MPPQSATSSRRYSLKTFLHILIHQENMCFYGKLHLFSKISPWSPHFFLPLQTEKEEKISYIFFTFSSTIKTCSFIRLVFLSSGKHYVLFTLLPNNVSLECAQWNAHNAVYPVCSCLSFTTFITTLTSILQFYFLRLLLNVFNLYCLKFIIFLDGYFQLLFL